MSENVKSLRLLAVVVALLAGVPEGGHAQAGRAQVQEGNRLYEEGLFPAAHEKYLEGLATAPESGLIRFNDGNALYKGEDYERAVEAYQRAIETDDAELAGSVWYNLGNAFYRQQQLEESLQAYKQALRLRPTDVDSKHNLERVLEQMEQQEQEEEQQQEDGEQNEDEEDQQEQPQEQDQEQEQEQGEEQDGEPQPEEQGEPPPEPGQMTPQEAERLLEAIEEDPGDVDRKRAPATGRRPLKAW